MPKPTAAKRSPKTEKSAPAKTPQKSKQGPAAVAKSKKSAPGAKPRRTAAKKPAAKKPAAKKIGAPPADPALTYWLDFFARYHQANGLRPLTLALGPEPVPVTETVSSRYVYEVASRFEDGVEKWQLIAWEIDIPGIRLRDCKDQAEALELFERRYIYGPGVGTVRLRADFRPW